MKSVVIFKQLAIESNINWVTEVKYLGLYIRSGQKCNCNFDKQKFKFYRSANCILTKHGNLNTPVTLHLVHSIGRRRVQNLHALEALPLTKTQIISIEHPQIISIEHPWSCIITLAP